MLGLGAAFSHKAQRQQAAHQEFALRGAILASEYRQKGWDFIAFKRDEYGNETVLVQGPTRIPRVTRTKG